MTRFWTRLVVVLTVIFGLNYVAWRWAASLNWEAWWIAVPLVIAETYSLIDVMLFGMTVWNLKIRKGAPEPPADATVDVFITTYNEDLDMVMTTALAAQKIRHPHSTWILDDGARPELKALAEQHGLGYVTRSEDWTANVPRHAKAGNLNNALMVTHGEFLLILDADQIPEPDILEKTLGYFNNRRVALVQTPQYFSNVPADDPLGSQAPLFYGPIQQGKDGWNAAFFCGSNAILRREALMQLGLVGYVKETEKSIRRALAASRSAIRQGPEIVRRRHPPGGRRAGRGGGRHPRGPGSSSTPANRWARSRTGSAAAWTPPCRPSSRPTSPRCRRTSKRSPPWNWHMSGSPASLLWRMTPCSGWPPATGPRSAPWNPSRPCWTR